MRGARVKILFHTAIALFAILSLAGCQQTVRPADGTDITGIYYLLRVDGNEMPGTAMHDDMPMEIHSGTFFINADGTCISKMRFTPQGREEETRVVHAKYTVEDSRLIMKWKGAGTTEGTVEGDIFTMDNHGMIFEYTRKP
jgi:hypothetical protein